MGIIKEPLEVDFFVDPRPLTKEEMEKISAFIEADKKYRKQMDLNKRHIRTTSRQPTMRG
ncbi:MAG: hypothetical protein NTX61_04635 [Bacteroidetes bacterium]|nr:hypothetical protein [Bacteroidota bacterium]